MHFYHHTLIALTLILLTACTQSTTPTPTTEPTIAAATNAPIEPTTASAIPPTTPPEPTQPAAATAEPSAIAEPTTLPTAQPSAELRLEPIADGFEQPVYLVSANDDTGRLFVVEQAGVVKILQNNNVSETPFLDIVERVGSSGNEQGLLSIAFHPNYRENGLFFANYTNRDGDTIISRFQASGDVADPQREAQILEIDQPYPNHNGGLLKFGPDGYLYIGMGDGGSGGDPQNHGQNLDSLLGKMLRIDVDAGEPYAIPSDNPFAQGGGRPEIWALGLRNPWRYSFDKQTGDLWIGDVGQNKYEEIDFQPSGQAGLNYGWKPLEGAQCYVEGCDPTAYTAPVIDYSRDQGCSVTGGYVYRGQDITSLQGWYLYGDYCTGTIWMLRNDGSGWQNQVAIDSDAQLTSFGEDPQGELYVVDRGGAVYRIRA
jgi:glucose/arabinose dehydrogenase